MDAETADHKKKRHAHPAKGQRIQPQEMRVRRLAPIPPPAAPRQFVPAKTGAEPMKHENRKRGQGPEDVQLIIMWFGGFRFHPESLIFRHPVWTRNRMGFDGSFRHFDFWMEKNAAPDRARQWPPVRARELPPHAPLHPRGGLHAAEPANAVDGASHFRKKMKFRRP